MAVERRRPRKRHKSEHPKRKRKPKPEKKEHKKKKRTPKATGTGTGTGAGAGDSGGGGSGGGGGQDSASSGDTSSSVATPDNTGTDQGMDTSAATPATLQGQSPDSSQDTGGIFSTGPGAAQHYHPLAQFVEMVATYTDASTADAGSTQSLNQPPAEASNPT